METYLSIIYRFVIARTEITKQFQISFEIRGLTPYPYLRLVDLQVENPKIYKSRKFACRSLSGGAYSGIRIIYAYYEETDKTELIEIYYKGDKKNEDRKRIFKYYKE